MFSNGQGLQPSAITAEDTVGRKFQRFHSLLSRVVGLGLPVLPQQTMGYFEGGVWGQ